MDKSHSSVRKVMDIAKSFGKMLYVGSSLKKAMA